MRSIIELLDKAQAACSPATGNGLAAALDVKPSAVSNWKHGRAYPDTVSCERIAQLVGEPPLRVIAQVNELRAVTRAEKAVWHRIALAALLALVSLPVAACNFAESVRLLPIMSITGHLARFLARSVFPRRRNRRHGQVLALQA